MMSEKALVSFQEGSVLAGSANHLEVILAGVLALVLFIAVFLMRRSREAAARGEMELRKTLENAQRRLRSSISDTRSLLDQQASIVLVFDRQNLTLLFANQQALEVFGCRETEDLSDKVIMKPDAWQPEPYTLLDFEHWMNQLKTSGSQRKEWLFSGPDQQGLWTDCFVGNTVFEGKAARILSANNIHRYKMDRVADSIRNRVLTGISAGVSLESTFDSLCKLAEVRLGNARCQIAIYDQQRDQLVTMGASRFARELHSKIPVIPVRYGSTSIGTAAYTRKRVLCETIKGDHQWQGYASAAEALEVDAVWSEPVLDQRGQLLGVFSAFSGVPKLPDDEAIEDMTTVVSLIGLAIERQAWRQNLEAAAASERFIRQLGVDLLNLPSDSSFRKQLRKVLQRIVAHYELGELGIWAHNDLTHSFELVVATGSEVSDSAEEGRMPLVVREEILEKSSSTSKPAYINAQEDLYPFIALAEQDKPVLLLGIDEIDEGDRKLGFVTAQSRYVFIAQEVIEHLQVISTLIRTVLLNRRLVQSLSMAMDMEKTERRKLESELSIARSIQMSMVPGAGQFKEKYRNWTIEAWLQPAKAVGGDLYEFIRLPNGKAVVAVGDVSDKGAPAALFMAKTVSLLNLLARTHDGDLGKIADDLNRELCRSNDSCMFVTLILCVIDLTTGKVTWLNGGHNAPLDVQSVAAPAFLNLESGPPLGLYENASYAISATNISPGQKVTLYSDGITEAFNAAGEEFGDDRLLSLGYRANLEQEGLLDFLKQEILDFIGQAPQSDDITLLTIHHHGAEL